MSLKDEFETATRNISKLSQRPANDELLVLYALFKQATEGDVKGDRPGMLDIKGRKKYDSWALKKGKTEDEARGEYVQFVRTLQEKYK